MPLRYKKKTKKSKQNKVIKDTTNLETPASPFLPEHTDSENNKQREKDKRLAGVTEKDKEWGSDGKGNSGGVIWE